MVFSKLVNSGRYIWSIFEPPRTGGSKL